MGPNLASGSNLHIASEIRVVPYVRCFLRPRVSLKAFSMLVSL